MLEKLRDIMLKNKSSYIMCKENKKEEKKVKMFILFIFLHVMQNGPSLNSLRVKLNHFSVFWNKNKKVFL